VEFLILILLFFACCYSGFMLRKLDVAAKLRMQALGSQPFRFMIGDLFSLMLLIQLPLKFLAFELDQRPMVFLFVICLIAVVLVWLTTIKTVSQAGIVTFGWRALISMVLIPTMYIGCFYFAVALPMAVASFFDRRFPSSNEAMVWLVVALLGVVVSPWIVRGALNSVSQPPVDEKVKKVADPFAD